MTVASLPAPLPPRRGDTARWIASAAVILALHAGAMIAASSWHVPIEATEPPPPAIMIELAPAPAPQPTPPPPPPPEPPKAVEPPPPPPEPPPPPPPEPPPPPPPPEPAVTLPAPRPPPPPPKPRPVPRRVEPPPIETPPPPVYAPPPPTYAPPPPTYAPPTPTVAPPPVAAPIAPPRPAPPVVAPPSPNALADFQRSLLSHLERAKRYPRDAQLRREEGTVYLRFRMDRSGRVLSAGVDRSSGFPDLDAEVLDMINRAQPLPAIPATIPQNQLELSVPVRFSLR